MSLRHAQRSEVVIDRARRARIAITIALERQCIVGIARDVVEAANLREAEVAPFGVVHQRTVDIDLVVLVFQRTETVIGGRECHRGVGEKDVCGGAEHRGGAAVVVVLIELRLGEGERRFVENGRGVLAVQSIGLLCAHNA